MLTRALEPLEAGMLEFSSPYEVFHQYLCCILFFFRQVLHGRFWRFLAGLRYAWICCSVYFAVSSALSLALRGMRDGSGVTSDRWYKTTAIAWVVYLPSTLSLFWSKLSIAASTTLQNRSCQTVKCHVEQEQQREQKARQWPQISRTYGPHHNWWKIQNNSAAHWELFCRDRGAFEHQGQTWSGMCLTRCSNYTVANTENLHVSFSRTTMCGFIKVILRYAPCFKVIQCLWDECFAQLHVNVTTWRIIASFECCSSRWIVKETSCSMMHGRRVNFTLVFCSTTTGGVAHSLSPVSLIWT